MLKKVLYVIVIFCLSFIMTSCNINRKTATTCEYQNYYRLNYIEWACFTAENNEMLGHSSLLFVPCGETTKQFMAKTDGNDSTFFDRTGKEITDYVNIASGMVVKDDKMGGDYVIVVKGDVDGDGELTYGDSELVRKYLSKETSADGVEYLLAADVDLSFSLTEADAEIIEKEVESSSTGLSWYNSLKNYNSVNVSFDFCSEYLK